MSRDISISYHARIDSKWKCDNCGMAIEMRTRRTPCKCAVCGKDLCKSCKRHLHVEAGTGNGELRSHTFYLCPADFVVVSGKLYPIIDELNGEKHG